MEKIFISLEFQSNFPERCDFIKSHENPWLHPVCRKYIFGKTTAPHPSLLKVKNSFHSQDV